MVNATNMFHKEKLVLLLTVAVPVLILIPSLLTHLLRWMNLALSNGERVGDNSTNFRFVVSRHGVASEQVQDTETVLVHSIPCVRTIVRPAGSSASMNEWMMQEWLDSHRLAPPLDGSDLQVGFVVDGVLLFGSHGFRDAQDLPRTAAWCHHCTNSRDDVQVTCFALRVLTHVFVLVIALTTRQGAVVLEMLVLALLPVAYTKNVLYMAHETRLTCPDRASQNVYGWDDDQDRLVSMQLITLMYAALTTAVYSVHTVQLENDLDRLRAISLCVFTHLFFRVTFILTLMFYPLQVVAPTIVISVLFCVLFMLCVLDNLSCTDTLPRFCKLYLYSGCLFPKIPGGQRALIRIPVKFHIE